MLLEIQLSPDLNWIFESISNGIYNTNHPINFNKLILIIGNVTNYSILNFLLLTFFIYLIWKSTSNYFTFLIIFLLLVLNSYFYIQKDNIFLVAFGVYFIYAFNSKLVNSLEENIIFLIIFLSFLTFPLFGLLLFFGFLFNSNRRIQYIIIFLLFSSFIYQWEPLKNQDSYSSYKKLNHVIASDSINISKRAKDYTIIPNYFFQGAETSLECVINFDNANNLINRYGVANIDYLVNNNCVNINNKLSISDYLNVINKIYFKNFLDYCAVKISHALQLLARPYDGNIFKFFFKIILGPIWLIITIIYLILSKSIKSLIIIFPVYIHFLFIILFAPGYDIRYTYPEFISLVFLYFSIFKNESENKTLRR
jgi:hypothetical protein